MLMEFHGGLPTTWVPRTRARAWPLLPADQGGGTPPPAQAQLSAYLSERVSWELGYGVASPAAPRAHMPRGPGLAQGVLAVSVD